MTKSSTPTKAELHEMLAQAVRNTQPQPVRKPTTRAEAQHATPQDATRSETHGEDQKRSGISYP